MGRFDKIINSCRKLDEAKDTVEIHGDKYNKTDVITLAQKFNHRVITLSDALDVVSRYDLFQELKRIYINKDNSYEY